MILPNYNCSVCNKDKHEGWCEIRDYGNGMIGIAYEKDIVRYCAESGTWMETWNNSKGE